MLTSSSGRVVYDLTLASRNNYQPFVFVRQWLPIQPWAEFRCYVQHRRLIGTSQYDCTSLIQHPQIRENEQAIRGAIDVFFDKFKQVSHLNDVIVDLFISEVGTGFTATLVEINPFVVSADACLFDWENMADFDGSFRYV